MALMRTSRKAKTGGPGDPIKPKNLKPVTVTGDKNYLAEEKWKSMDAPTQYKTEMTRGGGSKWDKNVPGLGSRGGASRLSPSELEEFNKRQQNEMGYRILAKEVRYAKGDEGAKSGKPKQYQVDYADPIKDKAIYEMASRKRNDQMLKDMPPLKTKKLASTSASASLQKAPKKKEMVSKAIEAPIGQGRSFKKKGSVTNRLKSQGGLAGGAEGRKFRKEEKLAGAYERSKKYADQNTPEGVKKGANVSAGAFSKEKKAGYKSLRSDIRSEIKGASKLPVSTEAKAGYKKDLKSAIKDTRKSQKFEKKEQVGKTKYFTKAKMSEQVEKKPGMKGRMQAGKMRYK